ETPRDVFVNPGHYKLEAAKSGHTTITIEIDIKIGEEQPVDIKLPKEGDSDHPKPSSSSRPIWPAAVGFGVTAGILGAAIGTLVVANEQPEVSCPASGSCPAGDDYQDKQNSLSNA